MILIAAVLLIAGTILFILFVRPKDIPLPEPVSPTAHLEERKARIYENLRDLQFEYRLGKLSDEDYRQTKLSLQKELTQVLAEIDNVLPAAQQPEAKSAAKKTTTSPTVCPHCGAKFPKPMKFCGECGKAMHA
ncbi:MAG TPA: hypothetical protein VKV15_26565 [Bryobacteraceae bacterium]|nr:hypothetical protein [Bryobacteraceae bacterium]